MEKFGIGQPAARIEDQRLLTGHGKYLDDLQLPNQAWACYVRSPHAHARIVAIATEAACAAAGVLAVYTVADLKADGIGEIPCLAPVTNHDGSAIVTTPRPALADGRVRFVGDPVAMVVATTPEQARDAAELVWVEYEQQEAVVETGAALTATSRVWDTAADNRCFDWQAGDRNATETAFAAAARIVSLDLVNNRLVPNPMETRGAIGALDENGRMVLHVSCQGVHMVRGMFARNIFHCEETELQVLCHDVGGGFGMKLFVYPEYVTTLFAARRLKRPVKWVSDRSEAFLTDCHGRDHLTTMQLALDENARIKAIKVDTIANLGAYLSNYSPFVATLAGVPMLVGCYDIPTAHVRVQGVFTHTAPVDAYRGAGRPEAIYALERALDVAARELKLSPLEIRRRNFIKPAQMPYKTALGSTYDSGDFQRNMEDAARAAGWDGFAQRRAEAESRGKLRGIGLASYIERCAGGAGEQARLEVSADGHITLYIGTQSNGQGHETAFRQIICDRLGVTFADITMVQGDSDRIATGGGTGGSRSVPVGGSAVQTCSLQLLEKVKLAAADLLEAAAVDVEFDRGEFRIVGTDKSCSFRDVARAKAPADGGASFDESAWFTPNNATYPNGTHICELEIDPDTGTLQIQRYTVVDDFGKVINPLLLAGQVHGGIGQGLGQALLEHCVYEAESGQLQSASFQDYAMPRAYDMVEIGFSINEVPCATNPLGIKGAGEAGAIGAPPAIINAIVDALASRGVRHIDMPATPQAIWRHLQ